MVPCHNSHHTAVKIHWKNVLLHFKDLVFHCFLYIVPYFLGAIWSFIFILHLLPHRHPLHLASLLLIRHELDFRLWKSSNWIFQDKSNGEETTHSQNGWGWKALLEIICQLVERVSLSLLRLPVMMSKQHWTQNQPLGHSTSEWCPA